MNWKLIITVVLTVVLMTVARTCSDGLVGTGWHVNMDKLIGSIGEAVALTGALLLTGQIKKS